MIIDNTLVLSDSQAITATAASTNVIDLHATGTAYGAAAALSRDVGKGARIPFVIRVTEAFNTLTSLTVSIETDDNASFSSATTVYTSPPILLASLTLGARITLPDYIPEGVNEQYFRLKYTVAGSNPTLGKIFAGIAMARQTNN